MRRTYETLIGRGYWDDEPGASGGGAPEGAAGGAGAGEPTSNEKAASAPPSGTAEGAPSGAPALTVDKWREALPEELRGDSALKPHQTIEDLAKDLVGMKRLMGQSIRIPTADAGEEAVKAFHMKLAEVPGVEILPTPDDAEGMARLMGKLGMPQTPEEYQLNRENLPEGVQPDPEMEKWFRKVAHEARLTNQQAALVDQEFAWLVADMQRQAEEARQQAEQELMRTWGGAYERRKGAAAALVSELYEGDQAEALKALMEQHPLLTHAFGEIAARYGEDTLVSGDKGSGGGAAMTPAEIQTSLDELMNNPAYRDNKHPQHRAVLDKVSRLFQLKADTEERLRQRQAG